MEKRRCTGTAKSTGERCKKTPEPGATVCKTHGGGAPQVIAAAERRVMEGEVQALVHRLLDNPDAEPVTDPAWELARIAGRMGHAVDVLGAMVNDLQQAGRLEYRDVNQVRRLNVLVEAWERLLVEHRRTLTDMTRLGIDKMLADQLAKSAEDRALELYGEGIGRVIQRTLDGLNLTAEQMAQARELVRGELLAIAAGTPT